MMTWIVQGWQALHFKEANVYFEHVAKEKLPSKEATVFAYWIYWKWKEHSGELSASNGC